MKKKKTSLPSSEPGPIKVDFELKSTLYVVKLDA